MSYRVFLKGGLVSVCLGVSTLVLALEYEDPAQLQLNVNQYVSQQLVARFGGQKVDKDFEIKVMPLDTRLRLTKCHDPVSHTLNTSNLGAGQTSVKVSCGGATPWSIYTPVQIAQFGEVAVASRSLARGDVVQPGDIQFERQNLSQLGPNYVDSASRVVGFELKRPLREGEALRLSYVEPPKIVQRGDRVTLEAQANGLAVVAPGMAMANGQMGERIRVKNSQSERIVDALVIAPGRVRVPY